MSDLATTYLRQGRAFIRTGDLSRAKDMLERARALESPDPSVRAAVLEELAGACELLGDPARAANLRQELAAFAPPSAPLDFDVTPGTHFDGHAAPTTYPAAAPWQRQNLRSFSLVMGAAVVAIAATVGVVVWLNRAPGGGGTSGGGGGGAPASQPAQTPPAYVAKPHDPAPPTPAPPSRVNVNLDGNWKLLRSRATAGHSDKDGVLPPQPVVDAFSERISINGSTFSTFRPDGSEGRITISTDGATTPHRVQFAVNPAGPPNLGVFEVVDARTVRFCVGGTAEWPRGCDDHQVGCMFAEYTRE